MSKDYERLCVTGEAFIYAARVWGRALRLQQLLLYLPLG